MGSLTLTGLKPGETTITFKAGSLSRTVPVGVGANLFPDFSSLMPYNPGGVTFESGPSAGSVRIHGTATVWEQIQKSTQLEAGTYRLGGVDPHGWDWGVRVNNEQGTMMMASTTTERMTASLSAGKYFFVLFVNTGISVDETFTPTLTRVGEAGPVSVFPVQLD